MSTPAKKSGPASDEVPRPKGRWLAEAHEALLLSIIDSISMESINANKDGIEDAMARRGFTYSYDAIRAGRFPQICTPSQNTFTPPTLQPCTPLSHQSAHHTSHNTIAIAMARWEELRDDLFEATLSVFLPLTRDQQDAVVQFMNQRGHNTNWNAISRHHHPYIAQPSLQVKMSRPATWDDQVYLDVLKAMNNHFRPNAMDCHHMVAGLHAKGHKFSENALLYGFLSCSSLPNITQKCSPNQFLFTLFPALPNHASVQSTRSPSHANHHAAHSSKVGFGGP
ncbi:hypothetical protein B0T25DRAFT_521960 [Lasiosphaeria hispida]|uniref:Uncharacterized protein n=1 Tax=Lasiosphaeria hispida TaxID=260671 RepID=A0AAJ0H9B6_9PEZI|nr:hypothetical protein B0T25DRAFT_521960 [Lasiosphaeria hispida]